eukprot:573872-Rhodomonas_salina.1
MEGMTSLGVVEGQWAEIHCFGAFETEDVLTFFATLREAVRAGLPVFPLHGECGFSATVAVTVPQVTVVNHEPEARKARHGLEVSRSTGSDMPVATRQRPSLWAGPSRLQVASSRGAAAACEALRRWPQCLPQCPQAVRLRVASAPASGVTCLPTPSPSSSPGPAQNSKHAVSTTSNNIEAALRARAAFQSAV